MGVGGVGTAEIDEELRDVPRRATDVHDPYSLERVESRGRGIIARDGSGSDVVTYVAREDADAESLSSEAEKRDEKMASLCQKIIDRRGAKDHGVHRVEDCDKTLEDYVDALELPQDVPRDKAHVALLMATTQNLELEVRRPDQVLIGMHDAEGGSLCRRQRTIQLQETGVESRAEPSGSSCSGTSIRCQFEGLERRVFDPETANLADYADGLPTFLYKFA
eukprot:2823560-Pyramimonas_sp.AAC.1